MKNLSALNALIIFISCLCLNHLAIANDAPRFACRAKAETVEKYGNVIKNAGCVIFKYDKNQKPTHALMFLSDINNDGKVDGYTFPGGKRADIKYDRESKTNDPAAEGDPKFATLADAFKIQYSESAVQTACRETREETRTMMPKDSQGLDVIIVDLINPDDEKFFAFSCLAPDIDQLKISGGSKNGDFKWISAADVANSKISFAYANREILAKAFGIKLSK